MLLLRYVAGVRKRTIRGITVELVFRPPVPINTDRFAVMDDHSLVIERVGHGTSRREATDNKESCNESLPHEFLLRRTVVQPAYHFEALLEIA